MKKIIIHILLIAVIVPTILGAFTPRPVNAACMMGGVTDMVTGNSFSVADCINELSTIVVLPIAGKFLQIGGYLFGASVKANLYISDLVDSPDPTKPSVIELVWKNIRDISSIIFIGVLLYASFMMILGSAGQGIGKLIVSIVLAGLFMNFSLFATRLVIDASNTISLAFYNAITPTSNVPAQKTNSAIVNGFISADSLMDDGGISKNIMGALQVQTILASSKHSINGQWALKSIITIVGGVILMVIAGIAFFAGAIMFIYRLITLIILMALSPLPVIASILPKGQQKFGTAWTEKLISQCLFAPVYLLIMYIALRIATDEQLTQFMAQGGPKSTFADVLGGFAIGPLLQYGIVIALMYYALVAANSFGAKGASLGMEWMKGVQSWGQGIVGRNTAARLARGTGRAYDSFLSNPNGGRITGALKAIGSKTGIDRGIRETLTRVETAKYGGTTLEGEEKKDKARAKDLKNMSKKTARKGTIESNVAILEDDLSDPQSKAKAHIALKEALKNLSAEELKDLGKDDLNKYVASRLSASQFETVMKNESMSEEDKSTIKKNRSDGLTDIMNGEINYTEVKEENGKVKVENKTAMGVQEVLKGNLNEIAKLSGDNLALIAPHLTREQYKKIMGMNDVSAENKQKVTKARVEALDKVVATTTPGAPASDTKSKNLVKSMEGTELLEATGRDVEKLKTLAPYLQASHLKAINSEINADVAKQVAEAIVAVGVTAPAFYQAQKFTRPKPQRNQRGGGNGGGGGGGNDYNPDIGAF